MPILEASLGRRDRKKLQTRAALVDAALRLAAERGLDHVTVEDISDAADVSSRTFFNYFGSKDEAIIDGQLANDVVLEQLRNLPPDIPVIGAIRLALSPLIALMEEDAELWLLRLRVIADNPSLLPRLVAGGTEAERQLTEAVAHRLSLPLNHGYPMLVSAVTGAAMRTATLRWAADCGARSLSDLVDEVFIDLAAGLPDPVPSRTVRSSSKDSQ